MLNIRSVGWCALSVGILLLNNAAGQSEKSSATDPAGAIRTAGKPIIDDVDPGKPTHPLTKVLKFAQESKQYVERAVRNYSCRLIKRERIDDELTELQYARLLVREEVRSSEMVVKAFAAFVEFMAPANVAGRKVLFVSEQNDNKMLVRRGGKRLAYMVVNLDPHGPSAQHESRVPITEASFSRIVGGLASVLERHIQADPQGVNTVVQHSPNARINGRACSVIRVVHPQKSDGLGFYIGTVYIDQQLHVPIRIEAHGWPEQAGEEPPLLAEYTYADLKLNVDLADEQFQPDAVRGR